MALGRLRAAHRDHAGARLAFENALVALSRLIDGAPLDDEVRTQRAELYLRLRRPSDALADYAAMSGTTPLDVGGWYGQAECLRLMGNYAATLAACERALACDSTHVPSLLCKAIVLATSGDVSAAQRCFDEAHRLDGLAVARYAGTTSALAEPPDARAIHFYSAFAAFKQYRWGDYSDLVERAGEYFAEPATAPSDLSIAFPTLYLPLSARATSVAHIAVAQGYGGLPTLRRTARQTGRLRIGYIATKFS